MRFFVYCAAMALLSCHPSPSPVPPHMGDSGPGTAESACQNLAALGCGAASDGEPCAYVLTRMKKERQTNVDFGCITNAASKETVRACGNVECP